MNGHDQNDKFSTSFYHKYTQVDENLQAKIKPVLNQILESRVAVKELHIQYGIKFSGMMTSYQNRLEELNGSYEALMTEIQTRENDILQMSAKILDDQNK